MEDKKGDAKLSKGILEMKFMKKSKERVEKEGEDAESQAMYANEITEEMRKSGHIVFVEVGLTSCVDVIDGRVSFGGMNPDIEKLMQNDHDRQMEELERQKEKDVTDVEMAQNYSTLVDTMGKKFHNQGKGNKRKKFLKPADD